MKRVRQIDPLAATPERTSCPSAISSPHHPPHWYENVTIEIYYLFLRNFPFFLSGVCHSLYTFFFFSLSPVSASKYLYVTLYKNNQLYLKTMNTRLYEQNTKKETLTFNQSISNPHLHMRMDENKKI